MATQHDGSGQRYLETLFHAGTAARRTDGQLLQWYATGSRTASGLAFAALVERHGAMVLRTCRAVLRDEHEAQDAFQATFLVLVRRGRTLWVRDSLGPWLHRVARHTAVRARRNALRRMAAERTRRSTWTPPEPAAGEAAGEELGSLLHDEVDRLPERYRAPVVLCDFEGRTYEEAARHSLASSGRCRLELSL